MNRLAKALILLAVLSSACTKDAEIQEREYPMVRTFLESNSESITFTGEIFSKGKQEIIQYGFIYDTLYGKKVDTILFFGKPGEEFNITLQAGFAPNERYNVRAFVKTTEHYIFGNRLEFFFNDSKPVELYSFSPSRGTTGDTVVIEGKYFSRAIGGNLVRFGNDTAKVVLAEENRIYVKVPEMPEDQICQISVKTASSYAALSGEFERWYNWTKIVDSIPEQYQRGTKAGDYFVLFNNWTLNTMVCNVNTGSFYSVQFPGSGYSYYDPIFTFQDQAYFICNGSRQFWQYNPATDEWNRRQDMPGQFQTFRKPLVIGSVAYFILGDGTLSRIWEYDFIADTWTLNTQELSSSYYPQNSVTVGNKAYFYIKVSEEIRVYEFDPSTVSVKYLSDYPGIGLDDLSAFYIQGKIYFGLGTFNYSYFDMHQAEDLWEFNPQTLEWKTSVPFPNHAGYRAETTVSSQDGYIIRNYFTSYITEVYKFDPSKQ